MALTRGEIAQQVTQEEGITDPALQEIANSILSFGGDASEPVRPVGGFFNPRPAEEAGLEVGSPNRGPRNVLTSPYSSEDVGRELANMGPNMLRKVQQQLEMLGLPSGRPGAPDDATRQGFQSIIAQSNLQGTPWQVTLNNEVERMREAGLIDLPDTEEAQVVLTPDRNELKLTVRAKFREALDRDPTQAEMQMFVDDLMSDFQAAAVQNNAPGPEFEVDEDGQSGNRVVAREERNPVAAFETKFLEKFGGSIERLEEREETAQVRGQVQQALDRGP